MDSLLVSGFREGREGATEPPSSAHGRQEPRSPRGPHGGGGVIWLGVIQHPGRLALSRSMPEPGAHSILPCFATGPVHRFLRIRLSQAPMRYHRRPPQWRSACLSDNAHHTAAMVAPSTSGGGPRVCWKVERACSVASGRVPALETRQPGASECAWPGEVPPRRVWTLCPGPHPSLLFRGISRAPLCGCLIGSRYTSLLPRILTNSAEARPEPCLRNSVSCLLLESPRATET